MAHISKKNLLFKKNSNKIRQFKMFKKNKINNNGKDGKFKSKISLNKIKARYNCQLLKKNHSKDTNLLIINKN